MLSFGGLVEHECPRCRRPVELPLGALCDVCRREIDARASRLARLVAGVTTAMLALYVWWRLPADPMRMQQVVGGIGVVAWYLLTYLVVRRSSRELIK